MSDATATDAPACPAPTVPARRARAPVLGVAFASGVLFGFGLALSTMVKPEVVLAFLQLRDLGLLLVLGGAVTVAMLAIQAAPRLLRRPPLGARFERPQGAIDRRLVTGAAIFGVGWGLCGVCPGPAIAGLGIGNWPCAIVLLAILAGAYVQGVLAERSAAR
jgi:uncharacterized membrane protein YedE/YeeE